jgi:mannose-6-phosphate isomerase
MGTHSSGPAKIKGNDEYLLDWLRSRPDAVGVVPPDYPANDLPFLFKVLSIRTALSIQVGQGQTVIASVLCHIY